MAVRIVTDSTCDIPVDIARRLFITIVPLYIRIGDKNYQDGIDIDIERLHYELNHGKEVPKTSAPSPGDFIKVYSDLAAETDQIISIHVSSGYSGTCGVARVAKDYVKNICRVEVIDSNSVSVGLGLIVMAAAKAAQEGKDLGQIVNLVHQIIPQTYIFGKTDSFLPFIRGKRFRLTRGLMLLGKISAIMRARLVGEVCGDGKIRSPVLVLGQAQALRRLKKWAKSFANIREMALGYSSVLTEAEMLVARLKPSFLKKPGFIARLGCTTSTYVGTGILVIAVIAGKQSVGVPGA